MHEGSSSNNNSRSNSVVSEKFLEDTNANDSNNTAKDSQTQISLSELYTRCCHLREIMPIKATLSQLEGQTGTLPYLRFMNPRPTMIEVLRDFPIFYQWLRLQRWCSTIWILLRTCFATWFITPHFPSRSSNSWFGKSTNITLRCRKVFVCVLGHKQTIDETGMFL